MSTGENPPTQEEILIRLSEQSLELVSVFKKQVETLKIFFSLTRHPKNKNKTFP
jgi:hypothetical protein